MSRSRACLFWPLPMLGCDKSRRLPQSTKSKKFLQPFSYPMAGLLLLSLMSSGAIAQSSQPQVANSAQAVAEAASNEAQEMRREIEFWEGVARNDKVLLIGLVKETAKEERLKLINNRTNPNYNGRSIEYITGDTYVPEDRDEFKTVLELRHESNDYPYVERSDQVKYYLLTDWIPIQRLKLAKLQPPPDSTSEQQKRKELESLTDGLIEKWKSPLVLKEEKGARANIESWLTRHLYSVIGQVIVRTPAARKAYLDYLSCLDEIYAHTYLSTLKAIPDKRQRCYDESMKPVL